MHLHCAWLLPAENGLKPRAKGQPCPESCDRVRAQLFRNLKNQCAAGLQHPYKLGNVLMATGLRDVLKHKAGVDEAKIIVLQALQSSALVQLKIVVATITIAR